MKNLNDMKPVSTSDIELFVDEEGDIFMRENKSGKKWLCTEIPQ